MKKMKKWWCGSTRHNIVGWFILFANRIKIANQIFNDNLRENYRKETIDGVSDKICSERKKILIKKNDVYLRSHDCS